MGEQKEISTEAPDERMATEMRARGAEQSKLDSETGGGGDKEGPKQPQSTDEKVERMAENDNNKGKAPGEDDGHQPQEGGGGGGGGEESAQKKQGVDKTPGKTAQPGVPGESQKVGVGARAGMPLDIQPPGGGVGSRMPLKGGGDAGGGGGGDVSQGQGGEVKIGVTGNDPMKG